MTSRESFAVWICADLQHDLLAGSFLEKAVDVVGRMQFAAVYGENVVACFDVDPGLREWRLQTGIPVFAIVDFGDAVAAVLQTIVRAQQPTFYLLRSPAARRLHKHVADCHFAETLVKR